VIAVLGVSLFILAVAAGYALVGPERLERIADRWFGL